MEKVKNTIITLSDKITIINPKDNKATETDVSTVLFNIMNSDEYRNYKEKGENISGVDKWNYIHSGIPKVNYSGVIKNNCFLSYSNMVAVTVPNFCNGYLADGNETRDDFAKKIPFVYAAYADIYNECALLICKHDNTDPSKHKTLCTHIEKEIANMAESYRSWDICAYSESTYCSATISFDDKLIINDKCGTFHFRPEIKNLKTTTKLTKDSYNAMKPELSAFTTLDELKEDVMQHFNLRRSNSIIAAARFFAYRAKEKGIEGHEAYKSFVDCFNWHRCNEQGANIYYEFYEVFDLGL